MIESPPDGKYSIEELLKIGLTHKQSDFSFVRTYGELLILRQYMRAILTTL